MSSVSERKAPNFVVSQMQHANCIETSKDLDKIPDHVWLYRHYDVNLQLNPEMIELVKGMTFHNRFHFTVHDTKDCLQIRLYSLLELLRGMDSQDVCKLLGYNELSLGLILLAKCNNDDILSKVQPDIHVTNLRARLNI